ncbi:ATP-binding protein [Corallococcus carmarthensis]|uniref:ATP-binding protein n=1 Tax=Corallococcus carmarthensis TaxID=2316728 RepID=UPI00148D170E|nr:ATP-binding protein [Corallococcus carmarthensis]NOK22268.1 ATP-binding protein [Corallococcus carmarthensis]
MANRRTHIAPFKARARILALLGDQLIGTDQLAVFELVKNAYDADASSVTVKLLDIDSGNPSIVVVDDGEGMSLDTIQNIWLELGNNHREQQRLAGRRTPMFGRLPLGEKGVGRFAVHKLGHRIRLVTRPRGSAFEHVLNIDWADLVKNRHLDDTSVEIETRKPKYFVEENGLNPHGTKIRIMALRRRVWTRGDARQLYRSITAISSPFETDEAFEAHLEVPDHPEWIEEMPDVRALLEMAPWRFKFTFNGSLSWQYDFRSPITKRLKGRQLGRQRDVLLLEPLKGEKGRPVAGPELLEDIGSISGEFVAYDRDRKILSLLPQNTLVKDFLDQQGGVRVYRDGVRVYNYGEPSDDWLQLDIRRVNRPTQRLSRNIVIGAINISLETSKGLREKTNREGFDQNDVFDRLRTIVTSIIHKFEVERALDKDRLKTLVDSKVETTDIPVETPLYELREAVSRTQEAKTLIPLVDRVDKEYQEMRDMLLRAGLTGLNLAVIIHEVERGVRSLYESVRAGVSTVILEQQSRSLMGLVENVAGLLRQKGRSKIDIKSLVQEAATINIRRFKRHRITIKYALPDDGAEPFVVTGSSALLQNVLINLVDNSIYWLRVRWPDGEESDQSSRRIYIGVTDDIPGGRGLVIADNGPGFQDEPDVLSRPFFTRRPDGMGLGLYYASLAMSLSGGTLLFPEREDLDLPDWVDGAIIVMHFGSPK